MPFFGRLLAHVAERINVTFDSEDMFVNLSHAMVMFGILAGGAIVLFALRWIVKRIAFPRSFGTYINTGRVDPKGHLVFKPRTGSSWLTARHVWLELFFMVAIFATFWIAAYTAGFNLFTSGYTTVVVTLIGTYMFAGALQNFGSGFWLNVEDSYQEGNYVVIPSLGPECHGYVATKTAFHTLLRRLKSRTVTDPETQKTMRKMGGLCEFRVPNATLMSAMSYRDYDMETADLRTPMEISERERYQVNASGEYVFKNISFEDGVENDTTTHKVAFSGHRLTNMVYRRSKDV